MIITSSSPFPDRARPSSGTGQGSERLSARSLTADEQTRARRPDRATDVSKQDPVKTASIDPPTASDFSKTPHDRPVRISREGDAQALFVYDSLARYDPQRGRPVVDVYV